MTLRASDYRFWLLCTIVAMSVLVACSSGTTPGDTTDGATESAADSMTKG